MSKWWHVGRMMTAAAVAAIVATGCGGEADEPEIVVVDVDPAEGADADADAAAATDGEEAAGGTTDEAEASATDTDTDTAEATSETPTGADPAPGGATGDQEVATAITLTSARNEMNLQPDDQEWGLLFVDGARTDRAYGDLAPGSGAKLLIVDVSIHPVDGGNLFDEAFRVHVGDTTISPAIRINTTLSLGQVFNDVVVFEIPADATTVTFEGGLPESQGPARRATYELALEPGQPEMVTMDDAAVEATTTAIELISPDAAFNLQPDDAEWGTLEIVSVTSTLQTFDATASSDTRLIVVEFAMTVGRGGNFFDEAFRMQVDGEWYDPVTQLNTTVDEGEVVNGTMTFDVPRTGDPVVLEAGFPSVVADFDWPWDLRTATFEITFG